MSTRASTLLPQRAATSSCRPAPGPAAFGGERRRIGRLQASRACRPLRARRARALLRRSSSRWPGSASRSRTTSRCARARSLEHELEHVGDARAQTRARAPPRAECRRRAAALLWNSPTSASSRVASSATIVAGDQSIAGARDASRRSRSVATRPASRPGANAARATRASRAADPSPPASAIIRMSAAVVAVGRRRAPAPRNAAKPGASCARRAAAGRDRAPPRRRS